MAASEKGYTLIESMVVLSLFGILALLAVENLGDRISPHHLRHAGHQLAADLRLIRQKAITEGVQNKIRFVPDSRLYSLPGMGERSLPARVRFGLRTGIPHLPNTGSIPSDGISFKENDVIFQPNGTLMGIGGTVYLTIDPEWHDALAVTVNVTGRVKVHKWNGAGWK
jgi:prepilin-type N-terminal cleavage/methylation domain-containing protein